MKAANEVTKEELKKMRKSEWEDLFATQLDSELIYFHREYRFHPTRKWRFDFALENLIAVEVEGGIWTQGRHTRGSGFLKDCEKYGEAAILGWRVFRFPPEMIKDGTALDMVKRALKK